MDSDIREDEDDVFREWVIERIGADVSILGPGQLEIRLRRFDARKVQRLEGMAEELGLELEEDEGLFTRTVFRIQTTSRFPGSSSVLVHHHPEA